MATSKLFEQSHPSVIFTYFLTLLILCGFMNHPLFTSILTIIQFCLYYKHTHKIKSTFAYIGLLMIVCITNPLFVHRGDTILFQIKEFTLTKEALLYGFFYGAILVDMVLIFALFSLYFKREHWVFLFGNVLPKTGILFSMVLSFIPRFRKHAKELHTVQKHLFKEKPLKEGLKVFSMETSWAFESSVTQLDSMNARGFGSTKRTHFHLFTFSWTDAIHLIEIIVAFIALMIIIRRYYSHFYFYPFIIWTPFTVKDLLFSLIFAGFLLLPYMWRKHYD